MSTYREDAARFYEQVRLRPLKVLLWGPGVPKAGDPEDRHRAHEKRKKMREAISAHFPNAEVRFSEDTEMSEVGAPVAGLAVREAVEAHISDIVLTLLTGSPTAIGEQASTAQYPWFVLKSWVLIPESLAKSALPEFLGRLPARQLCQYTPEEFASCNVATVQAVKIVMTVAVEKRLLGAPIG